jgi:aspartate kinase
MSSPAAVVVKLGGDALASPERIAAEARRLAQFAEHHPVVAVTSARRGVTDHLLGLVKRVRAAVGGPGEAHAEADRAVATGEVVTASLLALALNDLGIEALSLDAREAGVRTSGQFGGAHIRAISTRRLKQLLARGVLPVVTGFQGWQHGRVATLRRGGTDTSAVALAIALGGSRTVFVKDADGLRTADPKLIADSLPLADVPHGFLTALTLAGAKVVHPDAARLAEVHRLRLEFYSLADATPATTVRFDASADGLRAVATRVLDGADSQLTAIAGRPADAAQATEPLREALVAAGLEVRDVQPAANGPRFIVPGANAPVATAVLHRAFVQQAREPSTRARRAS